MTERTVKLPGWSAQVRPYEGGEVAAYRQLIREVIFSVHLRKKELLAGMGMPAQPVSLAEIYLEVRSRVLQLRNVGQWPHHLHGKRWIDRRVNEVATPKYYPDGVVRVVSPTAGLYSPNPKLFDKSVIMEEKVLGNK